MTEWDGEERRTGMVTREEFNAFVTHANAKRQEMCDILREVRVSVIDTQRSLKCVHTTWEAHLAEYGDILKEAKNVSETRAKMRMAIAEKSIVALVWGMAMLVGYALWDYIKVKLH